MLDSVNRHRAIEQIESEGFRPAIYVSGAGARTGRKGEQVEEQAQKDHDRAMFGPQWQSKELSKKVDARAAPKEPKQEPGDGGQRAKDDSGASAGPRGVDYPLIHENVSSRRRCSKAVDKRPLLGTNESENSSRFRLFSGCFQSTMTRNLLH